MSERPYKAARSGYWVHDPEVGWFLHSPGECPRCHQLVVRVRRRLIDRVRYALRNGQFWRYRCVSPMCGWEGLCVVGGGSVRPLETEAK